MTLTTYSGLSTGVFRRLNRGADSAVFDDCISLAEAEINRRLALKPVRPQHTTTSFTIDSETENTPSDILDVDTFYIPSISRRILATTPQNMSAMVEQERQPDAPEFYAYTGATFRFFPVPDTSYTATLTYWANVPNLASGAPTNWLSLAHPDVYFHGILAHAYQEYFDADRAEEQAGLFDIAIEKVLSAYPNRPDNRPLRSEISQRELSARSTVFA